MSEQSKIYVPKSSAKEVKFQSGKTILKLSFHAATLAEFIRQHANEKGYVNFGVSSRREPGKFGETHCVWLDTWQPSRQDSKTAEPKKDDYKDVSRNWPDGKRPPAGTPRPELQKQLDAEGDVPF